LAILCCIGDAAADRRNFAFTYEPRVMEEGGLELEYYMTAGVKYDPLAKSHSWGWAHQVEVEYGVVDGVDVSMYQMFSANSWDGYKLRARYQPWATGTLPIDIVFYLEFIQRSNADVALEQKLIFGRTFGKFIIAVNSTFEEGPLNGFVGLKLIENLALGYELRPWITFGAETQLRLNWEPKTTYLSDKPRFEYAGTQLYVGPTISFAFKRIFFDVNFSIRAVGEDDQAKYLLRTLWGLFL
jgi:hypothetical protein